MHKKKSSGWFMSYKKCITQRHTLRTMGSQFNIIPSKSNVSIWCCAFLKKKNVRMLSYPTCFVLNSEKELGLVRLGWCDSCQTTSGAETTAPSKEAGVLAFPNLCCSSVALVWLRGWVGKLEVFSLDLVSFQIEKNTSSKPKCVTALHYCSSHKPSVPYLMIELESCHPCSLGILIRTRGKKAKSLPS